MKFTRKVRFKTLDQLLKEGWVIDEKSTHNYLSYKGGAKGSNWVNSRYGRKGLNFCGHAFPKELVEKFCGKIVKVKHHSKNAAGKPFITLDIKKETFGDLYRNDIRFHAIAFTDDSIKEYLKFFLEVKTGASSTDKVTFDKKFVRIGYDKIRITDFVKINKFLKSHKVI